MTPAKNASKFWGNPPLGEPELYYDVEKADEVLGKEIAHFDFGKKVARVHMPNLEERLGKDCLEPVLKHEIGHYSFCPYDIKTLLVLINEANKVLNDMKMAKYAENIFADTFLNTHIVNKGDKTIIEAYKRMGSSNDRFWNLYMRTCEILWKLPPTTLCQSLELDDDARKLSDIAEKNLYNPEKWPESMRDFAEILKKYLPKNPPPETTIDQHDAKDFVPYDSTTPEGEKELSKQLSGISEHMTPVEFAKVTKDSGICLNSQSKRLFYQDAAKKYEIPSPKKEVYGAVDVNISPVEWLPEDETNELDVEYSLQQHGRIIPGETTYKWRKEEGRTGRKSETPLDILICLDTSGSMPDSSKELSIPTISAMAVAHSALKKGAKVAVINFSDSCMIQDYTSKKTDIDNALLEYFGGGTVVPGSEIVRILESSEKSQHVLLITDTSIKNLNSERKNLEKAINLAEGGTIFLAGQGQNSNVFEKMGYRIQKAGTPEDLLAMTKQLSRRLYG